jgi:tetrahydromethanopterin S-methyltransferase subunit G
LTEGDFTKVQYWFDMIIKAAIGVVVSIVGLDYRAVKNSLKELEENKYRIAAEVQVINTELTNIKLRLDRIEGKLDKVLSR